MNNTIVCTQEFWSKRMANQCRLLNLRGWGRWHDIESDCASDELICLEKLFVDKLGIIPTIDFSILPATQSSLANMDAFKAHFDIWMDNKQGLIDIVNTCIKETQTIDIQLYKKFICLAEKLQDDKVAVRMCKNRLEIGKTEHDLMICSMKIHKYFECEHKKGDRYNINLG